MLQTAYEEILYCQKVFNKSVWIDNALDFGMMCQHLVKKLELQTIWQNIVIYDIENLVTSMYLWTVIHRSNLVNWTIYLKGL